MRKTLSADDDNDKTDDEGKKYVTDGNDNYIVHDQKKMEIEKKTVSFYPFIDLICLVYVSAC